MRLVGLALAQHMSGKGDSCFPGLELLGKETGLAKSTVALALNELAETGWIERVIGGGRGRTTRYTATIPETVRRAYRFGLETVRPSVNNCPTIGTESVIESVKEQKPSIEVQQVYDHWRQERGKKDARYARISPNRSAKIKARLREGYTVAQLCAAVDAVKLDSWGERGRNDDLVQLLRNAEKVDRWLDMTASSNGACKNPTSDRTMIPPQRLTACGCHDCLEALEFVK